MRKLALRLSLLLVLTVFGVGTAGAQTPSGKIPDNVTLSRDAEGRPKVTIDGQQVGTTIRVTHDGLTVVSTVAEIDTSLVRGDWLMHHQTCWSHYIRHSDSKGSYWTKTLWCANNTTKILTWKEVTGDIDSVNWPWTAYDDDVATTAGGVGKNYHEDTGRGKFRYCAPGQSCVNVLDITKIWKEQYGDGVTDSDVDYESESL